MEGFAKRRLVLVLATSSRNGSKTFDVGTGYFLTSDLVLTASHVVPDADLTCLEVRTENDGEWRKASLKPAWRDATLDAVLLRVLQPLPDVAEPGWLEGDLQNDVVWRSGGYPDAGKVVHESQTAWKSVGLTGKVLAYGGGGQGQKELELTVESPPPPDQWAGISGAPVFVDDRLAGFVKDVPRSFQGGRFAAVPISALLSNHGFRLELSPPWLEPVAEKVWVLAVLSEAKKGKGGGLPDWVDRALAKDSETIELAISPGLRRKCVRVQITDALESPGRWLRFLRALCAAPIAIFDATGFEPAVMLALGVRAVVRRGVTLTSTADEVTPAQLSQLPFNIQETKLIHHGGAYPPAHANHPQNAIAAAIKRGWQELDSQPHYLDLPAYDAVRGPYPADVDGESSVTRMLVLCSFAKDHEANWLHISNALTLRYDKRQAARMLEVASPRLVGQALYEGIRWARTCMVDWTGWRANVFFELGVRMGCADVGPVCVIEQRAAEAVASGEGLTQRRLLMTLIAPTSYRMDLDDEGLPHALAVHDAIVQQRPPALPVSQLPHDATFRTCRDWFDWNQEHITMDPQDFLRGSIEAPFGKDVQAAGHSPVLFSANEGYSKDLDRSVKERWLAAWLYVSGRYPKEQWKEDRALRAKVRKLANDVLQFALQKPGEPLLIELRDQLRDVLKELAALDALEQPTEAPTERIRALKTAAKNQRDRGLEGYPRAESLLREAIAIAEAELGSPGVAERGVIATELSDCFGLIGGVQRRWAEETVDSEQKVHLKHSVIAYDAGFGYESSNSKDGPVGSYNLVNRLLVRLFWDPEALAAKREVVVDPGVPALNLADELEKAGAIIRRQLAGPRRGDHWAMADLALIDVLLERGTAASAYAEFIGASPRDFEYESALATVRPLAKLPLASAGVLLEAERLLEDRLKRLRS